MAREPHNGDPWYAEGLRFRCTACGQCCTGEPGHVWVTPEEIKRIAKARGLSKHVFRQRYVVRVGKRFSLKELDNGDCCMLKDGKCTVYAAKPQRCTTFPFWEPVLESRGEWEEAAERCEGIGQGDLYTQEEIERIRDGDAALLLKKHEQPPETPVYSRHNPDLPDPPDDPDWAGAFEALEALYATLDEELPRWEFTCSASGNCCDFDSYGHRLYVTALEAEYFFRNAPPERANDDPRQCPAWGEDRLCQARDARMLGCRTYYCPPYPCGVPEDLHERYGERVKSLHERFRIPYAYKDIVAWAAERKPAQAASPEASEGP